MAMQNLATILQGNSFVLKGGRLIDPVTGRDEVADIAVLAGRIAALSDIAAAPGPVVEVDAAGLVVAPGLLDIHVHLREPGQTEKEDIASGGQAALHGGFTTIMAMPNTTPPLDSVAALHDLQERCRSRSLPQVLPCPALTMGQAGRQLTDIPALKAAGARALSEDGKCLASPQLMRQAMIQAQACGMVIVDHCEDQEVAANGVLHDGAVARRLGLPGKPRSSEDLMVARDIVLAAETGCAVHVQHISSRFSVELIAWAKQRGLPVSAEATPHHLLLTEAAVLQHGANAKMNPPLREESDRQAILQAVINGIIEVVATDHAPHTAADKAGSLAAAANGIIGLETALPLCLTELHHRHGMKLLDILARFTKGPRQVLGLPQGSLAIGEDADLVVFDPDEEYLIEASKMVSKARNTPFDNYACRGRIKAVFKQGRCLYQNDC